MSRPSEAYSPMPEFSSQPEGPPQPGMSPTTKTLLIVLSVFGGFVILCCGGFLVVSGWLGYRMAKSTTQDPVEVVRIAQSICPHELPSGFMPELGLDTDFPMKMKMASFTDGKGTGTITFSLLSTGDDESLAGGEMNGIRVPDEQDVQGTAEYQVFLRGATVPVYIAENEDMGTFTAMAMHESDDVMAVVQVDLQTDAYPEPRPIVEEFLRSINQKAGKGEDIRNPNYVSPETEPATRE
ncbi:MAG: hypothetical protein D6741_06015 [Planctomycetota bacterium]|nr:MAG: hypothetical protein D6741_06015 [Planctomycetota bacterium]